METTVQDPLAGKVLDSRYRIDRRIARGGMATVYQGFDLRLKRVVAVKVMHPALADDEAFVARFEREATSVAALSSPDVVAIHDSGADAGSVYLVMEHVPGRTLRDVLRERGALPVPEATAILERVLSALAAAHDAGIVHRDVKPENVLLSPDGRVKVADFGLARAVASSELTGTGSVLLGTVNYLSPEQVEGRPSDARSDVYAAGILAFELLTGVPPFAGETPMSIAYHHVHADVPAPSSAVPGVPGVLDELVQAATARDAERRPADAGALLRALRSARRTLGLPDPDLSLLVPGDAPEPDDSTRRGGDTAVAPFGGQPDALPPPEGWPGLRRRNRRSPLGGTPRRRALVTLAVVLVALALVGGTSWWFSAGRYTTAPALLDVDRAAAIEQAREEGFEVSFGEDAYSENVPAGLVLAQEPAPGERIRRGATIELVLSLGPERYTVPPLQGVPLEEARARLQATSLAVGGVSEVYDDQVPRGSVVTSDPPSGERLRRDTAVDLQVSRGPEPVEVRDVRGRSADEAAELLEASGFEVQRVEEYDDEVPRGQVVSTDPSAGERATRGTTVTMTVSRGPEMVQVPDVSGMNRGEAESRLREAGLEVEVNAFPGGPGEVLRQDPGAGQSVERGTRVTLYVF